MATPTGPLQTAFTAGEFAPQLYGRTDLQKYLQGCRTVKNMIVGRQGGARSREGTIHVTGIKNQATGARLVPFVRSSGESYILEVGELYIRFYRNHAQIESGGSPYEVVTPWSLAETDNLRFAATGDVIYISHPSYAPRRLSRTSDTSWTLVTADIEEGPFRDRNTDEAVTITASAVTGSVTLTASSATFTADHVGSVWKIEEDDRSTYDKWQGQKTYPLNTMAISRGKVFELTNQNGASESGVVAPDHTDGEEKDGRYSWTYRHSLYGVAEITAFTSSTQVTATVVKRLPDNVAVGGSWRWYEGAWSEERGYPTNVAFFQERLVFTKGQTLFFSQTADFENFSPTDDHGDVTFLSALNFTISDPQVNNIRAIAPLQEFLFVATTGSEYSIGPSTLDEPFGPDNVFVKPQSTHGAADFLQPLRVADRILFANRTGKRMYELEQANVSKLVARELSILARHLTLPRMFEAAYAEEPDGLCYAITNNGGLISMTYEPDENVIAWAEHELGGDDVFVESICAVPSPDEAHDELWLLVARTVDGGTVRYVEYLSAPFEDDTDVEDGVFLDSAVLYSGAATTTVTGLDHLENESVAVLRDGVYDGRFPVVSGQITIDEEGEKITVGLPYTQQLEPLPPDPGSAIGASQGRLQRVTHAYIRFNRSGTCKYGVSGEQMDQLIFRMGDDVMDEQAPLFTGIKRVAFPSGADREPTVLVEQDLPLPVSVHGISYDVGVTTR